MTPTNGIIEIRTLNEINGHFVIDPECILTKETYSIPIRPYRLIKPDAKCQYLKKGKRCAQEHQHGYIVECKDGKQVLIGNCCALNHLGLDDEQIVGRLKTSAPPSGRTYAGIESKLCLANGGSSLSALKLP